jgi:PAS domain S-box-containing protein
MSKARKGQGCVGVLPYFHMPQSLRGRSNVLLVVSIAVIAFTLIQLIFAFVFPSVGPSAVRAFVIGTDLLVFVVLAFVVIHVRRLTDVLDVGEFDRQQALDEVRKLMQVIDTNFDGIVLTDTRGVIRHVNPKWVAITGWTAEETEGKMTPAILKSGYQDATFYTNFWLTIQNGKTFRGELINKRKDGKYYRVDEIVLPIKDRRGRVSGFAAFHHVLDADYMPPARPPIERPAYTEAS